MSEQYDNDICQLDGCYGQRDDCSYLSPDYIDSAHGKRGPESGESTSLTWSHVCGSDPGALVYSEADACPNCGAAPVPAEPAVREVRRDESGEKEYVVVERDISELVKLLDLRNWQRDRVWYWLDNLHSRRMERQGKDGITNEWDIDNNLPMYTRDFYKLYSIDGHLCDCHRGDERCFGCESLDCKFHSRRMERPQARTEVDRRDCPQRQEGRYGIHEECENPSQREEFEHKFGVITDDQWQWLKEFVTRDVGSYDKSWWINPENTEHGWQHFCENRGGIRIGLVAEYEVCAYGCGVERPQARTSPGD